MLFQLAKESKPVSRKVNHGGEEIKRKGRRGKSIGGVLRLRSMAM
jgi:hypothetical protein